VSQAAVAASSRAPTARLAPRPTPGSARLYLVADQEASVLPLQVGQSGCAVPEQPDGGADEDEGQGEQPAAFGELEVPESALRLVGPPLRVVVLAHPGHESVRIRRLLEPGLRRVDHVIDRGLAHRLAVRAGSPAVQQPGAPQAAPREARDASVRGERGLVVLAQEESGRQVERGHGGQGRRQRRDGAPDHAPGERANGGGSQGPGGEGDAAQPEHQGLERVRPWRSGSQQATGGGSAGSAPDPGSARRAACG